MSSENIKKAYYAVIPADVRYHPLFKGGDPRLLYGEISALCNDRGYCWATNDYFCELYKVEARTIQRWLLQLVKAEFIYIDNNKGRRKIFISKKLAVSLEGINDEDVPDEEVAEAPEKPTAKKTKIRSKLAPKKKPAVKFTDDDLRLAELLLSKIIYNFPTFENKKVNISDWAEDIRKLREIDKASPDQISFMIHWVHGGEIRTEGKPPRILPPHDFWSQNILSAGKLRKQWFENLVPKLQEWAKKTVKKSTVTQL